MPLIKSDSGFLNFLSDLIIRNNSKAPAAALTSTYDFKNDLQSTRVPKMVEERRFTNLELISRVDTWPYFQRDPGGYRKTMTEFYYFMIDGFEEPFGYVHSSFIQAMPWPRWWSLDHEQRLLTLKTARDFEQRTKLMHDTLRSEHEKGNIDALRKWSNELFPIYAANGEHVMDIDGCGVDLFGIVNFAVHMLAYVRTRDGLRFWVPRRSKTKLSYPNMLDNTVGGILSSGERPIDCIVRECAEEASLPQDYIRENIKACGTLSYQMSRTDDGEPGCQHQVQYIYEIELEEDIVPKPFDGEVQEFLLKSLEEVQDALARGEFKLNCAMTWMAYLIRHGVVNAENEPNFLEICSRFHRKHDLFII